MAFSGRPGAGFRGWARRVSNHDLTDGLDRVAGRIGLLGISRDPIRPGAPTIEPSRRGFGSITVAVATVLGSAGEMQTRDIHQAIEEFARRAGPFLVSQELPRGEIGMQSAAVRADRSKPLSTDSVISPRLLQPRGSGGRRSAIGTAPSSVPQCGLWRQVRDVRRLALCARRSSGVRSLAAAAADA
jgi:hypothetical protein